ncbi:hypothetical protein ACSNOI_37775 [Actinomadura kijaniata]|uniref:hypothetical protein n=1 Tax=Actinomadura kijaniata TaxID=46161 RepID=UPI003F1A4380
MSCDFVALVRRRPDVHAVADGLIAMGEQLGLRGGEPGPSLLYDAQGRLLVAIEPPVQVSVQSEIGRLLGPEFAARVAVPVWWVDVRAVADLPDAERVARRFAEALAHWTGGTFYPDGAPDVPALSWKATEIAEPEAEPSGFPGGVIGG